MVEEGVVVEEGRVVVEEGGVVEEWCKWEALDVGFGPGKEIDISVGSGGLFANFKR